MNFLIPSALLLGFLLPLIVILYLLKLRRVDRPVSSIYLWRKMVRDLEANAPWQKLRRNLLLFLQLLFLTVLILTIARPFTWEEGFGGKSLILIIDTSASMAASDVFPSRLEEARRRIEILINSLPQDVRVTVITAGSQARILSTSSLDRRTVLASLNELTPELASGDMQTALQIASAISSRQPETETIVYTDRGGEFPARLGISGLIRFVPIGISGENQSISLVKLEASPQGNGKSIFIQMTNHGETSTHRRLRLEVDGKLYNVFNVALPAHEASSLLVDDLPNDSKIVEAQLLHDESAVDFLQSDDYSAAVNHNPSMVNVNLVSQGNHFLETALSLLPVIEVSRIDPTSTGDVPPADVTILETSLPVTATLPAGNLLFIAPIRSTEFFSVTGTLEQPIPLLTEEGQALLKFISLENVNILDAVEIPLPDYAQPIIMTTDEGPGPDSPLLFIGEKGGRRIAVLAFNLLHSDLPLQVAFPLLVPNLINYLSPGPIARIDSLVNPGEAISLQIPFESFEYSSNQGASITLPDGRIFPLEPHDGRMVFSDTVYPGIYKIDLGGEAQDYFVVNPYIQSESEIQPASTNPTNNQSNQSQSSGPALSRQEWWRLLAAFSLVILVLEWLIYHRPTLMRFAQKVTKKNRDGIRAGIR